MAVKIKKEILIAIIGVLILLNCIVLFTVWRIHPIRHHAPMTHLEHDRAHRESMLFLHHELDLDDEQVSQLGELRQKHTLQFEFQEKKGGQGVVRISKRSLSVD